jgi:hypothetical protein
VTQGTQGVLHPLGSLAVFATFGDFLHISNYRLALGIWRPVALTLAMPVIGIATDTQEPTHHVDWPGLLMLGDECIL